MLGLKGSGTDVIDNGVTKDVIFTSSSGTFLLLFQ